MKKTIAITLIFLLSITLLFYYSKTYLKNPGTNSAQTADLSNSTSTETEQVENSSASTTKTVVDKTLGLSYGYTDNFYFNNLLTEYVHPVSWPPKVEVKKSDLVCKGGETKIINGHKYCVTSLAERAAGSTYTTYTYQKKVDAKVVSINFVIRVPQCMNYDEPRQSACKNEVANFNIDNMVDTIFNSIKLL